MEKLDLTPFIEKHGKDAVLEILNDHFLTYGASLKLHYALNDMDALPIEEVISRKQFKIKGKFYSFKVLRQILLNVSIEEFREAAKIMMEIAWARGQQVVFLHRMLEDKTTLKGLTQIQRGILLRMMFTANNFVYDTSLGGTHVRRRKSNTMSKGDCLQQAVNFYVDLKNDFHKVVSDIKRPNHTADALRYMHSSALDDLV
jgi:hypothetical protein